MSVKIRLQKWLGVPPPICLNGMQFEQLVEATLDRIISRRAAELSRLQLQKEDWQGFVSKEVATAVKDKILVVAADNTFLNTVVTELNKKNN